jgi:WD40 repeat protein
VLQAKLSFGSKPPRDLQHDFQNSLYVVTCERRAYVLDDVTLNLKLEVAGSFHAAAASLDGKLALVDEHNVLTLRDLADRDYLFTLATGESRVEELKFSPLGLYLTARLSNPHGVAVWMVDKPESLFTFNENLKFADFVPLDGDHACSLVCHDEDYIKVWSVSHGRLKTTLDYSRKKAERVAAMRDGRLLAVQQKKDHRVALVDLGSGQEKTLYSGEEEARLVKVSDHELVLLKAKSLEFFTVPIGSLA